MTKIYGRNTIRACKQTVLKYIYSEAINNKKSRYQHTIPNGILVPTDKVAVTGSTFG